jgi:hypothetical protein
MFYLMTLAVGQIIQCTMMEQLPDNKLERMWTELQQNLRYHPSPCQTGVGGWGNNNQDQERLTPHEDLNPGYIEHKIVVLTTRFNAKTVVSQSYGLHEGRSGPNHPGIWTTGGNSTVYLTHKK